MKLDIYEPDTLQPYTRGNINRAHRKSTRTMGCTRAYVECIFANGMHDDICVYVNETIELRPRFSE